MKDYMPECESLDRDITIYEKCYKLSEWYSLGKLHKTGRRNFLNNLLKV